MRDIIYCAACKTYYLRKNTKLIKIDCLKVTSEEKLRCSKEAPERYWGGFSHSKSCGCTK